MHIPELHEQVRKRLRLYYCLRSEASYLDLVRRFILFHSEPHPVEIRTASVEPFLSHLAVVGRVLASTQDQAKSALLFLYRPGLSVQLRLRCHGLRNMDPPIAPAFMRVRWHDKPMLHPVVGRFAPSPTGPLHFGSLVAALGSWLSARSQGGCWHVRIEDIDPPREPPGAAQDILDSLLGFGLDYDGSVIWQSARVEAYAAALQTLIDSGQAYPCSCTRSDLTASAGRHGAACIRPWHHDQPYAWRLRLPADACIEFEDVLRGLYTQNLKDEVGDFVLRRADGLWAYQLTVVIDDAAQGITEVVRGADLLDSTPRQILLQRLLGLPTPRYLHLPLVRDRHGGKLSKSTQGASVDPHNPMPVLQAALKFLGQDSTALSRIRTPKTLLEAARARFASEKIVCEDQTRIANPIQPSGYTLSSIDKEGLT